MAPDLSGKVAIVTGGSRGIGLAIASALVGKGASVLITGLDAGRLEDARGRLVSDITDKTGNDAAAELMARDRVVALVADLREFVQAERVMETVVNRFGGLDILVNNAGVGTFADVVDMPLETWQATIDTNLSGVFHCCRAAIPLLRQRHGGWIINISSLAGRHPFAGGAAYCASKAGLNAFSEALMQEVRYDDIRVSVVMPGSVRTEFAGAHEGVGTEWKLTAEDVATVVVDLLGHPAHSLPSRVEIRPSKPRKR
jgi:NAD(P)-dependent dehydrogenase (short-subunit alcohol dehydrogenase family)